MLVQGKGMWLQVRQMLMVFMRMFLMMRQTTCPGEDLDSGEADVGEDENVDATLSMRVGALCLAHPSLSSELQR